MSELPLAPSPPDASATSAERDENPSLGRRVLRTLWNLPAIVLLALVWLYQQTFRKLIGMVFGRVCRFEPSCSEYFIGAVKKYGAMRGSVRGIGRICRCHPLNPGGYDPP